jgi:hypothetical protein
MPSKFAMQDRKKDVERSIVFRENPLEEQASDK